MDVILEWSGNVSYICEDPKNWDPQVANPLPLFVEAPFPAFCRVRNQAGSREESPLLASALTDWPNGPSRCVQIHFAGHAIEVWLVRCSNCPH